MASNAPFIAFARDLASALEDDCLTTPEAAQVARDAAAQHGVDGMGLVVHEVTDGTLDCARSNVRVGGRVEVTIRGPEASS